jgi:putative membrane protein insertion efficiency factor
MFKNLLKYIFIIPIKIYQYLLSPLMGSGCGCRFAPTCSHYAEDAIKSHGVFYGIYLAIKRILRCQPFGSSGYDPVPKKLSKRV